MEKKSYRHSDYRLFPDGLICKNRTGWKDGREYIIGGISNGFSYADYNLPPDCRESWIECGEWEGEVFPHPWDGSIGVWVHSRDDKHAWETASFVFWDWRKPHTRKTWYNTRSGKSVTKAPTMEVPDNLPPLPEEMKAGYDKRGWPRIIYRDEK